MFDIGWSELLVIAVVAIVVVGPKDLPKLMRSVGHYAGKLRRAASDFQRQFEEAMRESEVDEVGKAIESVRSETAGNPLMGKVDPPVMLPKPRTAAEPQPQLQAAPPAESKKLSPRKRAAAKPKPKPKPGSKTAAAKRKKRAEPAP